jgi:hypothetical protein
MNYYFEEHAREELRDAIAYYQAVDLEVGNIFRAASDLDEVDRQSMLGRKP